MKVKVYGDNFATLGRTGELTHFSLGSDGLWVHLTKCEIGMPEQSFSMEHYRMVRPVEPSKDDKAAIFKLEALADDVVFPAAGLPIPKPEHISRMIDNLRAMLPAFPKHSKDGCDCDYCLAHDSILTAAARLEKVVTAMPP